MQDKYVAPPNDYLSMSIGEDLVPEQYRGSDKFLDLVAWNVCYFHDRDQARVKRIAAVLEALNADVIVLEEVLEGSLAPVIKLLQESGAGYYDVAYGTTGGQQRVAVLNDIDWVRSKDTIHELFADDRPRTADDKEVFPRLPLWASLRCRTQNGHEPFDFQLLGVHLKSQMGGGGEQRRMAAERLSRWLVQDAPKVDSDVIVMGDFNEIPSSKTWASFHKLEQEGKAVFAGINKDNEFSHLMYKNKKDYGSRLDLRVVSASAQDEIADKGGVVRWKPLSKLIASNPKAAVLKQYLADLKTDVSDHMPVYMRFYYEEQVAHTKGKETKHAKAKAA